MSNSRKRRILKDYKEICDNPIPGVGIQPLEDNFERWHFNILAPQGTPYENIPFHGEIRFPESYPSQAPEFLFFHRIYSTGGGIFNNDEGLYQWCVNFNSALEYRHSEWKNDVGAGWTSSMTVTSSIVMMQMAVNDQAFIDFSISSVKQFKLDSQKLICDKCGHKGEIEETYIPKIHPWSQKEESTSDDKTTTKTPRIIEDFQSIKCFRSHEIFGQTEDENPIFGILFVFANYMGNIDGNKIISKELSMLPEYNIYSEYKDGRRDSKKNVVDGFLPLYLSESHWSQAEPIFNRALLSLMSKVGIIPMSRFASVLLNKDEFPIFHDEFRKLSVISTMLKNLLSDGLDLCFRNGDIKMNFPDVHILTFLRLFRTVSIIKTEQTTYLIDNQLTKLIVNWNERGKSVFHKCDDRPYSPIQFVIYVLLNNKYHWNDIIFCILAEYIATLNQNKKTKISFSDRDEKRFLYLVGCCYAINDVIKNDLWDISQGRIESNAFAKIKNKIRSLEYVSDWKSYFEFQQMRVTNNDYEKEINSIINGSRHNYLKQRMRKASRVSANQKRIEKRKKKSDKKKHNKK